jgi:NAD(P)-dependent dehydrogenase (short-subunit alcohol dehydrogenase family)
VHGISLDVSDWASVQAGFDKVKEITPSLDYVFANAGFAKPGLLESMSEKDFSGQMGVNHFGAAFTAKFALPLLKKGSHITFSGSVCSILSFAGYSGYGPSKYAVRGLAETLRNELKPKGIKVHLAVISPVDTPGLKRENECKPKVCAAIEGTATLFSPRYIADRIMRGICLGDYVITMELLSWLMLELNCGIIPTSNIFTSLLLSPFLPLIRWAAMLYIDILAGMGSRHDKNE